MEIINNPRRKTTKTKITQDDIKKGELELRKKVSKRIKKLFVIDEDGNIKEFSGHLTDGKSLNEFMEKGGVDLTEDFDYYDKNPITQPKTRQRTRTPYLIVKDMLTQIYNNNIPKDNKIARKQLPLITFSSKIAKHILNACSYRELNSDLIKNKGFLTEIVPIASDFINKVLSSQLSSYNEYMKQKTRILPVENILHKLDEIIKAYFNTFYQNQDNLNMIKSLYQKYNISN